MKSFVSGMLLCLVINQAFPQIPTFSYDENLDITNALWPDTNVIPMLSYQSDPLIGDGKWSKDFTVPGIIGNIYATATDGTNFYVGGNFRIAGSTQANGIVRWDGTEWSSLGEGPENGVGGDVPSVEAIAVLNGKVYIGGQFSKAGTENVNGIACWDGTKWNKLGSDSANGVRRIIIMENDTLVTRGSVYALFAHNNKIFLGGSFHLAGNDSTNGIASWDPETGTWDHLDGGLETMNPGDGGVYAYAFAASGDTIYAGGKFDFAGGVEAKNIARWDGTGWSAIGNAESWVYDLKFDDAGDLYANGYFKQDESTGACGIGKWDGNNWISITGPEGYKTYVNYIQLHQNVLYAGGSFETEGITPHACLARWNGIEWQVMDGLGQSNNIYFQGDVRGVEFVNGHMYVAGHFTKSGTRYALNVAEWDMLNSSWKILDDGGAGQGIHDGYIRTIEQSGDAIYAGGSFSVAGGVYAKNIAKWNGTGWESLGEDSHNGIGGSVYCILSDNNDVYAGGYFGTAGYTVAYHVARWDGLNWSPIGIGVGGVPGAYVSALAKEGNYLYVAGYFSVVGDAENYELPANSIARFNLTTNRWETLGRGIEYVYGVPGRVHSMAVHENKLYVAGEFQSADDKFYKNFAVLTDNKWSGLDGQEDIGIEGVVKVVKVIDNELYIGGILDLDQSGESFGILKWDGEKWSQVGERLSDASANVFVNDIHPYDGGFIAGGLFKMAGNIVVNNLAYFDGDDWNDIGGGLQPGVSKIALADNKIFIAGPREILAGGSLGIGLIHYNTDVVSGIGEPGDAISVSSPWNYPNPFQSKTTIRYSVSLPGMVRISVYDIHGREISLLLDEFKQAGTYNIDFDAENLPGGVYLYRINQGKNSQTNRMLLLK